MRTLFWSLPLCCMALAACKPQVSDAPANVNPCRADLTPIHVAQGNGARSPIVGQRINVAAVVISPYFKELGGFFVQEEQDDRDGDPMTSEGLFIQGDGAQWKIGDVVRLSGTIAEIGENNSTMTALTDLSEVRACGQAELPPEVSMERAPIVAADWEAFEAMLLSIDTEATLVGNYNLFAEGELTISLNGRQFTPTQRFAPGESARQLDAENQASRITLDDGSQAQWPKRISYLSTPVSRSAPYRVGSLVSATRGIVAEHGNGYRLHVLGTIAVTQAPRAEVPKVAGRIKLLSFNLLNLFNGDGEGGGYPTTRGATTPEEYERQINKLVATIKAVNADVLAFSEVENDGEAPSSAIAQLLTRLNRNAPKGGRYALVSTEGIDVGGDQIRVALVYKPQILTTDGPAKTLASEPFLSKQRPPLLQRFREVKNGGGFAVVVNHWKSKGGCDEADPSNADRGDLQGCWNALRVEAARALSDWLDAEKTLWGDEDVLIVGDLNSYAFEDPIRLLGERGYPRIESNDDPDNDYSFVYNGYSGSLDHVLASPSMRLQIEAVQTWHINADELQQFDYNIDQRSKTERALYQADPYRSSDHDPIIVGINPSK